MSGIFVDKHLKWDKQIDSVRKKVAMKFTLLRSISS